MTLLFDEVKKQYDESKIITNAKRMVVEYCGKKHSGPSLGIYPEIDENGVFIVSFSKVGESSTLILRTVDVLDRNIYEVTYDASIKKTMFNVYMQVRGSTIPDKE